MKRKISYSWLAIAVTTVGCSGTNGPGFLGEHDGSIEIALGPVPEDVGCIRILATADIGSLTTDFDVTLGEEFSTVLSGLPYGPVQFSGEAFEESCEDVDDTSVPSWVASAVTENVEAGVVNIVQLVMRRNGRVCIEVSFEDEFSDSSSEAAACGLDPDPGPCRAVIPRWYFDSDFGDCREFTWGGCFGNQNRFESLAECRKACDVERGDCVSSVCDLPPAVVGPCDAAIPRWTFDADSGQCERFIYGGCGGNRNNFTSRAACEESCTTTDTACGDTTCDVDQECRTFEETGEDYCADSCELTRCAADEVCELLEVLCVRAPCPPIAVCVPAEP